MIDHNALESARERLPEPAEDRPEEVDDVLGAREEVGFENGLALADVGYDEYPDNILSPSASGVLCAVTNHERVTEAQDVADELGTSVSRVEKAAQLHDVELPDGGGFDVEVSTETIDVPLHDDAVRLEDLHDEPAQDHRLIQHLAVVCGMGVTEVVTYLERSVNDARQAENRYSASENKVEDTLRDMNLLGGLTTEERATEARRRGHGEDELNRNTSTTVDLTEHDPEDYKGGIVVNNST